MIRAWTCDARGAREAEPKAAVAEAKAGTSSVWVDVDCEDRPTLEALLAPLDIHPLAIEDMVQELNRPKVDDYGDYIYLVVHSARWEMPEKPRLKEIDMLLGDRFLVTYHDGATRSVTSAHEVLPRRPELLARGPAHLLHYLLDVMVDHYLPIMDQISEHIDEQEREVFRNPDRAFPIRVLRLKRGMATLRRILGPQRDTVLALTRDEFRPIPPAMRPYLRDVYDRLARVSDLLESYRDELASLLELHVANTSNRLNEVIKVLTVIATLGLPLTVVTSYYGMNFRFPEYGWRHPHLYVFALLAGLVGTTWWVLKRRRWL